MSFALEASASIRSRLCANGACRHLMALAIAVAMTPITGGAAQDAAAKTKPPALAPLPPARPPSLGAGSTPAIAPPPLSEPATAKATPGTPSPSLPPASPQTSPQISPQVAQDATRARRPVVLGPLPAASRQRMHACGVEWQNMKIAGQTMDRSWRDFAEGCLTR